MTVLLALALAAGAPATTCPVVPLTPAVRAQAAASVVAATHQRVRPADVGYELRSGAWTLVWATPADAERGVFFFRGGRLIDTWGGVLIPGERRDGVSWATGKGVPPGLAGCFADAVLAGN